MSDQGSGTFIPTRVLSEQFVQSTIYMIMHEEHKKSSSLILKSRYYGKIIKYILQHEQMTNIHMDDRVVLGKQSIDWLFVIRVLIFFD